MLVTVVGVLLAAILGLMGYIARSLLLKLSAQDGALAESTRALAVLLSRVEPVERTQLDHSKRLNSLEQATAVLKQRIDDYLETHVPH